jgi:SpoVK/Ycf46/Vps4 family AAA+-type ATPase
VRLATGRVRPPVLGPDFPAQPLSSRLSWDDLVLLPPTAALLGQRAGRPVFRVDLALLTSKYIGETEKNLARLFHRAHAQDWILFFDEAEALFAKRSEASDAPARFANQLVAYLLQKVEEHPGLVILASNLKNNLDPAFARRFQALVHFPLPAPAQRLALWQQALPAPAHWGTGLDPAQLAQRYELSGAAILNIVQLATLRALDRQAAQPADTAPDDALVPVQLADLLDGIRLEGQKEGRLL